MPRLADHPDIQFSSEESVLELTTRQGRARVCWIWQGDGLHGPYQPDDPQDEPLLVVEAVWRDKPGTPWKEPPEGGTLQTRFHRDSPRALQKAGLFLIMGWIGDELEEGQPVRATLESLQGLTANNTNVIELAAKNWPEALDEMLDWLLKRHPAAALYLIEVMCCEHQYKPRPEDLEPFLQHQNPALREKALKLGQHVQAPSAGMGRTP